VPARKKPKPPKPAPPPNPDDLPHPVTFFLTAGERRRVLRALRTIHADRAAALLKALSIRRKP